MAARRIDRSGFSGLQLLAITLTIIVDVRGLPLTQTQGIAGPAPSLRKNHP